MFGESNHIFELSIRYGKRQKKYLENKCLQKKNIEELKIINWKY